MGDIDMLDPSGSWFFYEGRTVKLEGIREYGKIGERYSRMVLGARPIEGGKVEAFVAGDPAFVVKGALLERFVEIAGPAVSEIYHGRYRGTYLFATFGARSIELVADRAGIRCSAEVYDVADDILDQRDRLVAALNEAVGRMFENI